MLLTPLSTVKYPLFDNTKVRLGKRFINLIGLFLFFLIIGTSCKEPDPLEAAGQHYQQHKDYQSLKKVVEGIPLETDTAYVRRLLGDPIDMGFDFRYLLDSTGPKGCVVGAVFHISGNGTIDQKWIDEICE